MQVRLHNLVVKIGKILPPLHPQHINPKHIHFSPTARGNPVNLEGATVNLITDNKHDFWNLNN